MSISEYLTLGTQSLTVLGVLWNIYQNTVNKAAIEVVHHATNSMKDELVQEVRKSSFAAGQLDANRTAQEENSQNS